MRQVVHLREFTQIINICDLKLHCSPAFPQCHALFWIQTNKILTDAAKTFLAKPNQHVEAEITVSRFTEVFQPPQVITIFLNIL